MIAKLANLRQSLPLRLLLVFAVACLCVIGLLIGTLVIGFSSQWSGGFKPHLAQYLRYINKDIGLPPNTSHAQRLADELPINIYIQGEGLDFSSSGKPLDVSSLEFHKEHKRWSDNQKWADNYQWDQNLSFGELDDRTLIRHQKAGYKIYYEIVHGDPDAERNTVMIKALSLLLLILIASYLVLKYMLKPVQDISLGVKRMGEGELDYRLPIRADNDLGRLATNINEMAADIDGMLGAKRQLLLALSHELRSPLTRAKLAVNLMEDSAKRQSLEEDLCEMESLITEILEAERMNSRHAALHRETTDVAALIAAVVAENSQAHITQSLEGDLSAISLDQTRVRLLLRNLISNALTHGGAAARSPHISAWRSKESVFICVQDYGPGIEAEHLDKLTEPFYRADPSRTRSTGGFGLGLHLCKLITEAHQGSLTIKSGREGTRMVAEFSLQP